MMVPKKMLAGAVVCFVPQGSSARQRACCTASDVSAMGEGDSEMRLIGLRARCRAAQGAGALDIYSGCVREAVWAVWGASSEK